MTFRLVIYMKYPPIDDGKEQGVVIEYHVGGHTTWWGGTSADIYLRQIAKHEAERLRSVFDLQPARYIP